MFVVSGIFTSVGFACLIGLLLPGGTATDIKIAKTLAGIGSPFFLVYSFIMVGLLNRRKKRKILRIAKDEALKILKENPQLNPPLSNHIELVKWLEAYESLSWREKELPVITEKLNESSLEESKERVEKEIKKLKSELGIK